MGSSAASLLVDDRPGSFLVAFLLVVSVAAISPTQAALLQGAVELSPLGRHIVSHGPLAMAAAKVIAAAAVGVPRWFGRRICLCGLAAMTAAAVTSNALHLASSAGLL
jgi:uncharacterized membrane protein YccF (DUF307 family)